MVEVCREWWRCLGDGRGECRGWWRYVEGMVEVCKGTHVLDGACTCVAYVCALYFMLCGSHPHPSLVPSTSFTPPLPSKKHANINLNMVICS